MGRVVGRIGPCPARLEWIISTRMLLNMTKAQQSGDPLMVESEWYQERLVKLRDMRSRSWMQEP